VALVSAVLAGHALETGMVERAHAASIPSQEGYYLSIVEPSQAATQFQSWLMEQLPK
jgi:LysR family glycine cleavage system transcriptional activator